MTTAELIGLLRQVAANMESVEMCRTEHAEFRACMKEDRQIITEKSLVVGAACVSELAQHGRELFLIEEVDEFSERYCSEGEGTFFLSLGKMTQTRIFIVGTRL